MAETSFKFVGDALAFDFVNTEKMARRKPLDLLATSEAMIAWWNEANDRYQMVESGALESTQIDLEKAKVLRSALRRLFTAVVTHQELPASDLETLNAILKSEYRHLVTFPDGRLSLQSMSDQENVLMLTIAHSATWLLTECERERLHKCKNGQCVLMFLDTTKNGNRVWCSIDCMNRARSMERYRQQKRGQS